PKMVKVGPFVLCDKCYSAVFADKDLIDDGGITKIDRDDEDFKECLEKHKREAAR
ncbi:unnamed protein product, partial [marine sediment metagenome]